MTRGAAECRLQGRGNIWLVGQAVKTPASHAGNAGSIPARVTNLLKKRIWSNHRSVNCVMIYIVWGSPHTKRVGVDDVEGSPVPIPNTEVKLNGAEDTWLVTAWENRKTPTQIFLLSSAGRARGC